MNFVLKRSVVQYCLMGLLVHLQAMTSEAQTGGAPFRLITLDPAHFHAALIQKTAYPQVDQTVFVYAPADDAALKAHLDLIASYNQRTSAPTAWKEVIYTGPDYLQKMLTEKKGNVVVLAGNNKMKIDYIKRSIEASLHVFADKPMAINSEGFQQLKNAFALAQKKKVLLYDIMTERYQITNSLQKELSQMETVFGSLLKGSEAEPAVVIESVHHFLKTVSGKALLRPAWYFDVRQQGEGIVDVTTHLVDLVQWECFPSVNLNYKKDIRLFSAKRWPTVMTPSQFQRVTGQSYPDFLHADIQDLLLSVYANGEINYTLRGVHVRVSVVWNYEAPTGGGDTHYSILKGSKANLIIRQGAAQQYIPVLYIQPLQHETAYEQQLQDAFKSLQAKYPGLALVKKGEEWQVMIPDKYRLDHETTFGEVAKKFLEYLQKGTLPEWERKGILAKYYTTTEALKIATLNKQ